VLLEESNSSNDSLNIKAFLYLYKGHMNSMLFTEWGRSLQSCNMKNYAIPMVAWQGCQEPVLEHLIFGVPIAMRGIPIAMGAIRIVMGLNTMH